MKKLMIAAAIVCAAVMANASSFGWNVSNVAGYNGGSSSGYQAWLIENYTGTITGDNLATVIATYGTADDWGGIGQADANYTEGSSKDYAVPSEVSAKVLIIDSTELATAEHFYVTAAQETSSNGMLVWTPSVLKFDASATSSTGAWTAVPEPTSGLLLLLGVAGLALRRRRA